MSRLDSSEAVARLLRIIPLVSEQPDGMAVSEIVERFDYPRGQLLRDIEGTVPFVGVYPFTPDVLMWAEIADDRIYVDMPMWFSQPLRLPHDSAARVLALCKAALEISGEAEADSEPEAEADGPEPEAGSESGAGSDEPSALLRAFLKLSDELGDAAETSLDIRLGSVEGDTVDLLRSAIEQRRSVELSYYSNTAGEQTRRLVDPHQVFSSKGFWYLSGWCHLSEQRRPFRLDRILSATLTAQTFEADSEGDDEAVEPTALASDPEQPRVVLRVDPSVHWMLEAGFPVDEIVEADGAIEATIAVFSVPWFSKLLLRLGPHAEIVRVDPGLPADMRSVAAARLLSRYAQPA